MIKDDGVEQAPRKAHRKTSKKKTTRKTTQKKTTAKAADPATAKAAEPATDPKKTYGMSLAVDGEMQEALKRTALDRAVSVSALIREVVEKYIVHAAAHDAEAVPACAVVEREEEEPVRGGRKSTVVEHDAESVPVVLRVPNRLRGDREGLQGWLAVKLEAIANALS